MASKKKSQKKKVQKSSAKKPVKKKPVKKNAVKKTAVKKKAVKKKSVIKKAVKKKVVKKTAVKKKAVKKKPVKKNAVKKKQLKKTAKKKPVKKKLVRSVSKPKIVDSSVKKEKIVNLKHPPAINFHESIKKSPYEREARRELKSNLLLTIYLSLVGFIISIYLSYSYYSGFCIGSLTPLFDCNSVNQSSYALILGVPIAMFAAIFFLLLAITSKILWNHYPLGKICGCLNRIHFHWLNLLMTLFALVCAVYLFYISLTVIKSLCIWCLILDIVIVVNFIFALLNMAHYYKLKRAESMCKLQ
ncbi:vitamin K epoxide reductase family protein [Candidatus Woesearchaeota archaeon]|nr:vitamin K epoxide reductase family protein [Candidatus Woesearchaeota archaeon]